MPQDFDRAPTLAPPAQGAEPPLPCASPRPNHLASAFPGAPPPGDPAAALEGRPELGLYYPELVDSPAEGVRSMLFECFIGRYEAFEDALGLMDAAALGELAASPEPARAERLRRLRPGVAQGRAALRARPSEQELDLVLGSLSSGDLPGIARWLQAVYGEAAPQVLGRLQVRATGRYAGDPGHGERVSALMTLMGVGGLGAVVLGGAPEVQGRTVDDVAAELRARVGAYAEAVPGARQSAESSLAREQQWLAELGAVGRFVELFQDRERPDPGRWSMVLARWDEAGARMSQVMLMEVGVTTLGPFGEAAGASFEIFDDATRMDRDARAEFMSYLRGFSDVAETGTTVLTLVRDLSFATAVSIAVVLAAPVVMGAAGAAATGSLGLSGAGATAASAGATAATMGMLGASVEGGLRIFAANTHEAMEGVAALAAGQKTLLEAVDAFDWRRVMEEGWEGLKVGFLDGVLGVAGMALEAKALGRVMGAAPLDGVTPLGLALQRAKESAIASGVSGGVIGALDAGVREAMAGGDPASIGAAIRDGFVLGAALGAAFGGGSGAVEGLRGARRFALSEEIREMEGLLSSDPDAFGRKFNALVEDMNPQQRAAFELELQGRRFVDRDHYDAASRAFEQGESAIPPEHAYGERAFEDWLDAERGLRGPWPEAELPTVEGLQLAHMQAMGHMPGIPKGELRSHANQYDVAMGSNIPGQRHWQALTEAQLLVLRTNPRLNLRGLGRGDAALTAAQRAEGMRAAIVLYPSASDVEREIADFLRWYRLELPSEAPVAFAAQAQQRFISIHPFADGNGRLSRLMMDRALADHNLPPALLNDTRKDLFSTPMDWEREVFEGVMSTYRLAMTHLGAFNTSCVIGEPAMAAMHWGALLGLAGDPGRVVEWAYRSPRSS